MAQSYSKDADEIYQADQEDEDYNVSTDDDSTIFEASPTQDDGPQLRPSKDQSKNDKTQGAKVHPKESTKNT